jgi:hypothetical protein
VRPLVGALREEVERLLVTRGYEGEVEVALDRWTGVANLENRRSTDGIDARVLAELRSGTSVAGANVQISAPN